MIDVTGKGGCLWAGSWAPMSRNGLCTILAGRHFLHSAWDRQGISALLSDRKGNIILINTKTNKWKFLLQIQPAPCSIKFGLKRETEFLVALPDSQIRCYNINGELISIMGGHDKTVKQIEINSDGSESISISPDIAQIWNLGTFERIRKLNVSNKVELHSVHYLNDDQILTIFRDNSIFIWNNEKCLGQIRGPENIIINSALVIKEQDKLVLGGKSDKFWIYSISKMNLKSILEVKGMIKTKRIGAAVGMPEHLFYLADSQIKILNMTDAKIDLGLNERNSPVFEMAVCNEWITMINDNGNVELYHIPTIKGTISPFEADNNIISSLRQTQTDSPNKENYKIARDSITTGRINTKPLSAQNKINRAELRNVLFGFGEFPARYRLLIWRHLLKIPENESSFRALLDRGRHPSVSQLSSDFPLKSQRLFRALERTVSCVAHWNSLFGELDYIPIMIFPFIKLFQHSPIHCFEVVSSVLFNWSRDWFSFYPNPPIPILASIENVIAAADPRLMRHLTVHDVTAQDYGWPLLQTMFSEVFPRTDWMILFDHVFFNHPSFLLYCVAAYVITARGPLMSISVKNDFQFYFHHRNPIQAKAVIQEAKRLIRNTPKELDLKKLVKQYEPLTEGHYPILNKYPQFVVDYRRRETEKVRKREIKFLKGKKENQEFEPGFDPFENNETVNIKTMTSSTSELELVETHRPTLNETNRAAVEESEFAKGLQNATRARKMLLASFSRDF
jgi:hypothetical protein